MKNQWLAYVIVGLLSIGAGVAIAGLPDNVPVDATIVPPTTTVAADPTLPETTAATTTVPPTTEPEATAATTTTGVSTTVPDTTEPDTTDPVAGDLPDRGELFTIVANGSNISGAASRNVERLRAIGYTDIAPRNGTTIFEFTTIYFADGLEAEALRLAEDLELLPDFVAPLIDAPEVLDLPEDVQLLAYIGLDRA
jgi:hypothetical protein